MCPNRTVSSCKAQTQHEDMTILALLRAGTKRLVTPSSSLFWSYRVRVRVTKVTKVTNVAQ